MMFDAAGCSISGEIAYYEVVGESGNKISRGFCPKCGSPTIAKISAYPEAWFVYATSLEDPGSFSPTRVLWHSSSQPWDAIDTTLKVDEKGI
jgi:hypothetical protein